MSEEDWSIGDSSISEPLQKPTVMKEDDPNAEAKAALQSSDATIRAVQPLSKVEVTEQKEPMKLQYKPEGKITQLTRKLGDQASRAKQELSGTLDRVFDVYETPNFFQVFWVIVFLLVASVAALSMFVKTDTTNIIVALSVAASMFLLVGIIGYAAYGPKSIEKKTVTNLEEKEKYPGATDTAAATKKYLEED